MLFYGHYDVIAAENETGEWLQDPFKLSGLNGYIYGRGTSDNKVKRNFLLHKKKQLIEIMFVRVLF